MTAQESNRYIRESHPARSKLVRAAASTIETLEARRLLSSLTIAQENRLPGTPSSQWDVGGDSTLQGFATDISVNVGQPINFKITDTTLALYHIDIYRMGYYAGMGARRVATIAAAQALRVNQPAPLTDQATGLIDCGNWSVAATWQVPSDATSGIYFANLVREDTGLGSQMFFIVRNDSSHSDLLFQTSDSTWQAYNNWGGNSFYQGSPAGRAYKLSYNRPFATRGATANGRDFVFGEEYPMVRFLEANGYDVSYFTDLDADRRGAQIKQHKVYLSVGHDEYWSGAQRANVEAARDAGVNLAFFSGNEDYWKTRWETSIDGSGTPYRTLVCYKESLAGQKIDPSSTWTGLWRDPRFSPPADGGKPENSLSGTIFTVNRGPGGETGTSFNVPSQYANLRFWRGTAVASLQPGQTATLGDQVLGYEWEEDLDNGSRPAGLIDLSSTTQTVPQKLLDYGVTVDQGVATHSLTLYRAPSGALVFGAGTVQWSWGLDGVHDGPQTTPDPSMRQATVNLFADMAAQPSTLQTGLSRAVMSTDATAPTSVITNLTNNQLVTAGATVVISGTAADAGGGVLAAVEVSVDGGVTWHRATGTNSWTYSWIPVTAGPVQLRTRAVDDSVNLEVPSAGVTVSVKSAATSSAGLIAAFGFNEGSGTVLGDSSGRGNNGVVSGATWTAGMFGQALSFNGSSDWVTVADSSSLDLTSGMTLEAWVKPTAGDDFSSVLMKERAGGLAYSLYAFDGDGNPPSTYIHTGSDVSAQGISTIPLNAWSHLTSTYDGSDLNLYVNGSLVGTREVTGNMLASNSPLRIGGNAIWGEYFKGLIDNVRIYNRPLSQAEVLADMSTPVGGSVETTAPTAAISAPSNGANVSGSTNISAIATDNVFVAGVQMLLNGQPLGAELTTAPYTLGWDSRTVANGTYTLSARARDAAGNFTTSSGVSVSVNNAADVTPPSVSLIFPNDNQYVSGASLATVLANDNLGVVGVQLRVNGTPVGTEDPASPYRILWNSTGFADGPVTLIAEARDAAGNIGQSAPVTVIIDNTNPTVAATSPSPSATQVNPNANVSATFSEDIVDGTSSLQLRDAGNNLVPGSLSYDGATKTLTFDPTQDLALGATYHVVLSGSQDIAGNTLAGSTTWSFTTSTQVTNATLWESSVAPSVDAANDPDPIEVGIKFSSDINGYVTGIRFYKGAGNTGTHIGHLWDAAGNNLATATFVNETSSGWQQVNFDTPVAITANTTYVASYYAPAGRYAVDADYFTTDFDSGRLHAPAGANGVYRYIAGGAFPTFTFRSSNYWVDVVFSNILTDVTPPAVIDRSPAPGATGIAPATTITATMSESVQPGTFTFQLRDPGNHVVSANVSYNDAIHKLTLTPTTNLSELTNYTVSLSGGQDLAGNTMSPVTWLFTTSGPDVVPPTVTQRTPAPGATAVAPSSTVTATFSESVSLSTISFVLTDPNNHVVDSLLTYDDTTHSAKLSPGGDDDGGLPDESLRPSTTYTVTLSNARDLAGNVMQPVTWTFTTDASISNASLWNDTTTPAVASSNDSAAIEVGVKFKSSKAGYISGLRFYKGAGNTGTHLGHLWDAAGNLKAAATFVNERESGWQQVNFASPVYVAADTVYVASYYAPNGHYAANAAYFATTGFTNGPLLAVSTGAAGGNGVFHYGTGGGFPNQTYNATNYWVDVVFSNTLDLDHTPPTVISQSPSPGATGVAVGARIIVAFDEPINLATLSFVLRDPANNLVASTLDYDAPTQTVTLTPQGALSLSSTYTASLVASDQFGNSTAPQVWSFTTVSAVSGATIWPSGATPAVPAANDSDPVELGVKFRASADGFITGLRFYKGAGNNGTHVAHLWTASGTSLATAVFVAEGASGWQQVDFPIPVAIQANTTYVASYYAPLGHYALNGAYFATSGVTNGPLAAPVNGGPDGGNGVFKYGAGGGFPTQSYNAGNYWVDVVYANTIPNDTTPPTVLAREPAPGATGVQRSINISAIFSEPVQPGTINFVLRDSSNNAVSAAISYDPQLRTVTLDPDSSLAPDTTFTATLSDAADGAGNVMSTVTWSFTTVAAVTNLTIWAPSDLPSVTSTDDSSAIEVGFKFRSVEDGFITGIRFFKGSGNSGTHIGHLWTSAGILLATVTFSGESSSGWQQANFDAPVSISAGQTYVASYYAPVGRYSSNGGYFLNAGKTQAPLTALASGVDGANGVFRYGAGGGFPTQSYNASNYWVDVVYSSTATDTTPPTVIQTTPSSNGTAVDLGANISAIFSEPVVSGSIAMTLRDAGNNLVPASVNYDASTRTVTLDPLANLAQGATYSVTLSGARDATGNVMTSVSWSFTTSAPITGAMIWGDSAVPAVPSANDTDAVELGVKFQSSITGFITGIRFYKGAGNSGAHVAHLWALDGTLLGTATFDSESATGWQQASFASPVAIVANTTYIASYYAPAGHYAVDGGYFSNSGTTNGPLTALSNSAGGGNGVFRYGVGGGFPTQSYNAGNYWVDVVFSESNSPQSLNVGPGLFSRTPPVGSVDVATGARVTATFDQDVLADTIDMKLYDASAKLVPAKLRYDGTTRTATLLPSDELALDSLYTVALLGARNARGAAMTPASWTFTTTSVDRQAPKLVSASPGMNGSKIAPMSVLAMKFSESVRPDTISLHVLNETTHQELPGVVSYNEATQTVTIKPTSPKGLPPGCCGACSHCPMAAGAKYEITLSGAQDLAGNTMTPMTWTFSTDDAITNATLWNDDARQNVAPSKDRAAAEVGLRFRADEDGVITGLRLFNADGSSGKHVAHLWDSTGNLLGTTSFVGDGSVGWQQVNFHVPVPIKAGEAYVASYFAPDGGYAATPDFFSGSGLTNGVLHALGGARNTSSVSGTTGAFPNQASNNANYWVDVMYSNTLLNIVAQTPAPDAAKVSSGSNITATFSLPVDPSTVSFVVKDDRGQTVAGGFKYDAATNTAVFDPRAALDTSRYTVSVSASDIWRNDLAPVTWAFYTAPRIGNTTTAERGSGDTATNASSSGAANGSPLTRPSSFQPISTAILRSATGGAATSATFTSIAPTRSLVMARGDMSAIGVKLHSRQMFTDVPSSLEPLDMPLSESIVLADAFHIRDPGQLL